MTLWRRILAAIVPDVVRTLAKEMRKPKAPPVSSMPLPFADVEHIGEQIRRATTPCQHCGYVGGWHECGAPTSPRAIRPTMLPPPRRKR